ncbi:Josephin-like protein [Apostasia shenzhenica]|uniref:ubiquitinyl hydrolase 1 n=1 Tax=Apostasia shenzhenica TaxID=1088818 RepID=A0A2I0AHV3_9ASPA|nr:Josephin-like protein [Apostasia shenzhenica]
MEETCIYHERQRLQFCLLHALNNLLQVTCSCFLIFLFQKKDSFTRAELDGIAEKLLHEDPKEGSWTPLSVIFKPHHNTFTGNYDVNVLIAALEARSYRIVWHDHRNSASSINISTDSLLGIMLNIPIRRYAGLWRSRHWAALRRIGGHWYNLDSDLPAPKPFQNLDEVTEFLDDIMALGGEVLIVFYDKLCK